MRGLLRIGRAAVLAFAVTAVLLAAESTSVAAAPRAVVGPVSVVVEAPATATYGNWFDYTIRLTHAGGLTGVSPEFTVTDPLPPEVDFISLSITNGTCTSPAPGDNGTVSCTMRFAPATLTSTITITVEVQRVAPTTNTVQLSTGETASATTAIATLPPGSFTVTKTGPDKVTIPVEGAPARFGYTIEIAYAGPALTNRVRTHFTDQLPSQVMNPGFGEVVGQPLNCVFPPGGTPGGAVDCDVNFDASHLTARIVMKVRPTAELGKGTNTITLDTGDGASATTTFVAAQPPPPPGPPAAPTQTTVETFTAPGQAEPQAVAVAPSAETAQVVATWTDPGASLDLTNFQLVSGGKVVAAGRALAAADRKKPRRLKITKKRGTLTLEARVTNLKRGKLKFKVVARKMPRATKVRVTVRQSKKRSPR